MVESCEAKRERMLQQVRSNFSTVTDLADLLVREAEISFRDAHHVAGTAVRIALERGFDSSKIGHDALEHAAQSLSDGASRCRPSSRLLAAIPRPPSGNESRKGPQSDEIARLQRAA